MTKVGIIAEYNPFHNGHLYHLSQIKKNFPDAAIVLVLTSQFTQRGIPSILNKWDRTWLALQHGVDLVIELPFPFSTQSADIFAQGAIEILTAVGVDYVVFGSESNNLEKLTRIARVALDYPEYDNLVQTYMGNGMNYPGACNRASKELIGESVTSPNDLLGVSYIREILKQNSKIIPFSIKRTNGFHDEEFTGQISSATSIRIAYQRGLYVGMQIPELTETLLKRQHYFFDDFFTVMKYKIYSTPDLSIFLDVDEGLENRILKVIDSCLEMDELISSVKTRRYTYNKINRMLIHILCGFTKEESKNWQHVPYIRILGFSKTGKAVLREIKQTSPLPIYTRFQKNEPGFQLEKKVTAVYASVLEDEVDKWRLITDEYRKKPLDKDEYYV